MKFCGKCGSEVLEDGSCPSCDKAAVSPSINALMTSDSWISTMLRSFMLAFAFSGLMYFTTWPIILVTDSSVLSPGNNIYFMTLALGIIGSVALAFVLRSRILLLGGVLFSGLSLWFIPDLLTYLLYGIGQRWPLDYFFSSVGTLDNLTSTLGSNPADYYGQAYGWLVTLGFYLMSMAHLPVVAVGIIAIGQEAISENLKNRAKTTASSADSVLTIAAFIAAFVAPVAGVVLSLIALIKWSTLASRDRGFAVAALAISGLNVIFGFVFGLVFASSLIPLITGIFDNLRYFF